MKKKILLWVLLVSLSGCNQKDLLDYSWKSKGEVIIENGMYKTSTPYNPKTKKMEGDTMIPIKKLDSIYIITEIRGVRELDEENILRITRSELIADTVYLEIRNFGGPKLLIHNKKYRRPHVLDSNEDIQIPEVIKFRPPNFKIAELTIGDTINTGRFMVTKRRKYYNLSIKEAILLEDPSVQLEIVGDSVIYSISRLDIDNSEIKTIMKVIDSKMGKKARYRRPVDEDFFKLETYIWSKDGVEIQLLRSESGILKKWELKYDDKIKQALLMNRFQGITTTTATTSNLIQ